MKNTDSELKNKIEYIIAVISELPQPIRSIHRRLIAIWKGLKALTL